MIWLPFDEQAVTICRILGDTALLAHTVRHLGDLRQDAGRLDLAEPCYREALDRVDRSGGEGSA